MLRRISAAGWIAILASTLITAVACEFKGVAEVYVYFCVVDGDTILVPNDTSGIKCANIDSTLAIADSIAKNR